jgi:hypothetical protein
MRFLTCALLIALALPAAAAGARAPSPTPERPRTFELDSRLRAIGTDVAAPDQQAPRDPSRPRLQGPPIFPTRTTVYRPPSSTSQAASGFDWADAGIGAGGAALLMTISLGAAVTVRRRHGRRSSAIAA